MCCRGLDTYPRWPPTNKMKINFKRTCDEQDPHRAGRATLVAEAPANPSSLMYIGWAEMRANLDPDRIVRHNRKVAPKPRKIGDQW